MKKFTGWCCLAALCLAPGASFALDGEADSVTQLGVLRSKTPGFSGRTDLPLLQTVRLETRGENVFFNFYGWGDLNLRDATDRDGHLESVVLGYRFSKANALVKAGRFYTFPESGVDQIDGLFVRSDLGGGFWAHAYGGFPVRVDYDNHGDHILGGKLAWRYPRYFEAGVSALHEEGATTYRPLPRQEEEGGSYGGFPFSGFKNRRDVVNGSLWISPHRMVDAKGYASYNLITDGWQEQRYQLSLRPHEKLLLAGEYRNEPYRDLFSTTSCLQLFPPVDGRQRSWEGSANVRPVKPWELTGFYRRIMRDDPGRTHFDRYGAQTRLQLGNFVGGLRYMRADADEVRSRYHEGYGYLQYDFGPVLLNASVQVERFDEALYDRHQAAYVSSSATWRLTDALSLTAQGVYSRNRYYDNNLNGYFWLRYNPKL